MLKEAMKKVTEQFASDLRREIRMALEVKHGQELAINGDIAVLSDKPPGKIYAAMAAILKEFEPVRKKKNSQGHKVRGVDDAYNELHPLLAKHGVFIGCEVIKTEHAVEEVVKENKTSKLRFTRIHMRLNFFAEDGSSVSSEAYGEAFDSGDKAAGKAQSNAFKYGVFQTFCVATEELADSDSDEPPAESKGPRSADMAGPCAEFQRQQIVEIAQKIWIEEGEWKAELKRILAARDLEKLADLTYGDAEILGHKLQEKWSQMNVPY